MQVAQLADRIVFSEKGITKRIVFDSPQVLAFVLNFSPGQKLPAHRHADSALLVHVMTGGGQVRVDGRPRAVAAGDCLLCRGDEEFAFDNGAHPTTLWVTLSPRPADDRFAANFG